MPLPTANGQPKVPALPLAHTVHCSSLSKVLRQRNHGGRRRPSCLHRASRRPPHRVRRQRRRRQDALPPRPRQNLPMSRLRRVQDGFQQERASSQAHQVRSHSTQPPALPRFPRHTRLFRFPTARVPPRMTLTTAHRPPGSTPASGLSAATVASSSPASTISASMPRPSTRTSRTSTSA